MSELTLIFCHGRAWYSKIIQLVENGPYSHVAGILFGGTLESEGVKEYTDPYPGVWIHPIDKYKDGQDAKFLTIEIPNMENLEKEAKRLLGTLYGYPDCLSGGIEELFGKQLVCDGTLTMDCSELWVRLLRAGGLNILPNLEADCITPQIFYNEVIKYAK